MKRKKVQYFKPCGGETRDVKPCDTRDNTTEPRGCRYCSFYPYSMSTP
jgi:hypothetical protein